VTRTIESTDDRIQLYSRPPRWLTVIFALLSLTIVFTFCRSHELTCQRTEPHAATVRVKAQVFGITLSEWTIADVTAAQVQTSANNPRHQSISQGHVSVEHNDTSRLIFVTAHGTVPLTRSYLAGLARHEQAADKLNQFIKDPAAASTRIRVPASLLIWGAAAFLGFLSVGTGTGGWCRCLIDRPNNLVRITWPTLAGYRTKEYRLSDVDCFQIVAHESTRVLGFPGNAFERSLGMRLLNGDEISLTRQEGSGRAETAAVLIAKMEELRSNAVPLPAREFE